MRGVILFVFITVLGSHLSSDVGEDCFVRWINTRHKISAKLSH